MQFAGDFVNIDYKNEGTLIINDQGKNLSP